MTKAEAQQFKARWQMVNEVSIEEARRVPIAERLRQLAILFAAGQQLGWADKRAVDETDVRARWVRLKENAKNV